MASDPLHPSQQPGGLFAAGGRGLFDPLAALGLLGRGLPLAPNALLPFPPTAGQLQKQLGQQMAQQQASQQNEPKVRKVKQQPGTDESGLHLSDDYILGLEDGRRASGRREAEERLFNDRYPQAILAAQASQARGDGRRKYKPGSFVPCGAFPAPAPAFPLYDYDPLCFVSAVLGVCLLLWRVLEHYL